MQASKREAVVVVNTRLCREAGYQSKQRQGLANQIKATGYGFTSLIGSESGAEQCDSDGGV